MTHFHFRWRSFQGTITSDNRDFCAIGQKEDTAIYVLVDGASKGPSGGELARSLAQRLVDGFIALEGFCDERQVVELLSQAYQALKHQFPADTASYVMLVCEGDEITYYHAGDCRVGRLHTDGSVDWISNVHTLANATGPLPEQELVSHPDRHILTRSFRTKGQCEPDNGRIALDPGMSLILATDGFWADTPPAKQHRLVVQNEMDGFETTDDLSFLVLGPEEVDEQIPTDCENLYVKTAGG